MNDLESWVNGIPYEVAFWNNVCRWTHSFNRMMEWSNYGTEIRLDGCDVAAELCGKQAPVVLDVGCGMSYATGNKIKVDDGLEEIDIHYVDPLAAYYNDILRKHGRDLPPIEFGMGEYLSSFYGEGSVDLVVIQNALDHSANPLKVIKEAFSVLRVGGVLYLNHHLNEAEAENYKGFHKYNVCDKDGRLLLWNRELSVDVAEQIGAFAQIESLQRMEDGHVVAVVRKTGGFSADALSLQKDRGELCMLAMLLQKKNVLSFGGIRYRLLYFKYNFIQFFIQSLSWKWKMRLKRLLARR